MNSLKIYSIGKEERDEFKKIEEHLLKISSKYSKISQFHIINRDILKKQSSGNVVEIEESYSTALTKYVRREEFNIILDPLGKEINTDKFANILQENSKINFFIGGAYGFNDDFRREGDMILGLSKLTMSHKIAKVVLLEQIYRALAINNNHPYHK